MTERFDWRAHLKVHPAADLFPLMSESELKELAEDIKQNGLQQPIVIAAIGLVDDSREGMLPVQTGEYKHLLLDGRNRMDALALLRWLGEPSGRKGFDVLPTIVNHAEAWNASLLEAIDRGTGVAHYRTVYATDGNEESERELYELAQSLNVHRRHLTPDQKRAAIDALLKLDPNKSDRQIAEVTRSSPTTVGKRRKKGVHNGHAHRQQGPQAAGEA